MSSIAASFAVIAFVPMTVAIGLFHLMRPFGLLYALPAVVLIGLGVAYQKDELKSARFVLAAAIGQWFSLLAWIFSHWPIAPEASTRLWASNAPSVATAGFPLRAIEIPAPPMGSDVIPIDMWLGVFANHVFWLVVAFLVAHLLLQRITKSRRFVVMASVALGFYALIANLALFALWFD